MAEQSGITALKYLSRYLYRRVISKSSVIASQNGRVAFRYVESETGELVPHTIYPFVERN